MLGSAIAGGTKTWILSKCEQCYIRVTSWIVQLQLAITLFSFPFGFPKGSWSETQVRKEVFFF